MASTAPEKYLLLFHVLCVCVCGTEGWESVKSSPEAKRMLQEARLTPRLNWLRLGWGRAVWGRVG